MCIRDRGAGGPSVLPNAASNPSSPSTGQIYFNTTNTVGRIYDGSSWQDIGSNAPTFLTSSGQVADKYTTENVGTITISTVSYVNLTGASVTSGSLPSGLSLSTSGTNVRITGTIASGAASDYSTSTYNFTIQIQNPAGTAERSFSILVRSKYIGYSCVTTNGEGQTASATAPNNHYFTRVDFKSYGTPGGSCPNFNIGGCHSANANISLPTQSFSIGSNNSTWGDPCQGVAKYLRLKLSYGPNI